MTSRKDDYDKIDELADSLDDLKTTVDELAEEPPEGIEPKDLGKMKETLEKASDAADELEERK